MCSSDLSTFTCVFIIDFLNLKTSAELPVYDISERIGIRYFGVFKFRYFAAILRFAVRPDIRAEIYDFAGIICNLLPFLYWEIRLCRSGSQNLLFGRRTFYAWVRLYVSSNNKGNGSGACLRFFNIYRIWNLPYLL